jgi:hypothetical protein
MDEVYNLCLNDSSLISLFDKLKLTKFKVKYNLVDDLDWFTFPRKYVNTTGLLENEDILDDDFFKHETKLKNQRFCIMSGALLRFVKRYVKGDV